MFNLFKQTDLSKSLTETIFNDPEVVTNPNTPGIASYKGFSIVRSVGDGSEGLSIISYDKSTEMIVIDAINHCAITLQKISEGGIVASEGFTRNKTGWYNRRGKFDRRDVVGQLELYGLGAFSKFIK